jgi:hypothetical protein
VTECQYLTTKIVSACCVPIGRDHCMTRDGYTKLSGAPSSTMIRLEGETRWRRMMFWCFSNGSTYFVRIKGQALIIPSNHVPNPL